MKSSARSRVDLCGIHFAGGLSSFPFIQYMQIHVYTARAAKKNRTNLFWRGQKMCIKLFAFGLIFPIVCLVGGVLLCASGPAPAPELAAAPATMQRGSEFMYKI